MKITVVRGDITQQDVDAIVTAANTPYVVAAAWTQPCTLQPALTFCGPAAPLPLALQARPSSHPPSDSLP